MADIASVEHELKTVKSMLEAANFSSEARPRLEELKSALERELSEMRARQAHTAAAGM